MIAMHLMCKIKWEPKTINNREKKDTERMVMGTLGRSVPCPKSFCVVMMSAQAERI